jgi:hypothetical protein
LIAEPTNRTILVIEFLKLLLSCSMSQTICPFNNILRNETLLIAFIRFLCLRKRSRLLFNLTIDNLRTLKWGLIIG